MRLHCPKCAGEIAAADVNIRDLVAKCSQCDNVFGFENASASTYFVADKVTQPSRIKRKVVGDALHLSWDWSTPWSIPASIGAVLFLLLAFFVEFDSRLFVLVLASLGVLYWSAVTWVNSTEVIVDPSLTRITHGPLPWRKPRSIRSSDIRQLYTGNYHTGRFNSFEFFAVNMIWTGEGTGHERLIEELHSAEHAIYIEQEIEAYLGIADRPVRGELSRGL